MADYDWARIDRMREKDFTWREIAPEYGVTPGTIRKANSRRRGTAKDSPKHVQQESEPDQELVNESVFFVRVVQLR